MVCIFAVPGRIPEAALPARRDTTQRIACSVIGKKEKFGRRQPELKSYRRTPQYTARSRSTNAID
jgi:hypothetical protein